MTAHEVVQEIVRWFGERGYPVKIVIMDGLPDNLRIGEHGLRIVIGHRDPYLTLDYMSRHNYLIPHIDRSEWRTVCERAAQEVERRTTQRQQWREQKGRQRARRRAVAHELIGQVWEEEVYVEAWARPDGLRHIHTGEEERECDPRLHVLPIPDHCWPSPPTYLPGTTTARLVGERVDTDLVVHARVLALRRDGVWREVEGVPLT